MEAGGRTHPIHSFRVKAITVHRYQRFAWPLILKSPAAQTARASETLFSSELRKTFFCGLFLYLRPFGRGGGYRKRRT